MQRTDIIEFAIRLGLGPPARTSTANWLHYSCPFAPFKHQNSRDRTPSFGIAVTETEHSWYNCFACHSTGLFPELAFELGRLRNARDLFSIGEQIRRAETIKTIEVRKWVEDIGELYAAKEKDKFEYPDPEKEFAYYSAAGQTYLRERGISWATAIALGLRYDPYQRRILFPVKDRWGTFAGFTGRAIDGAYRNTDDGPVTKSGAPFIKVRDYFGLRKRRFLLGEHRCREQPIRIPIILVEGLFDYAYLSELGIRNVLALLGSALTSEKAEKLTSYAGVVLFLDNDAAGESAIEAIKAQLFRKVPLIGVKYPPGYDGADPASLPPSVIKSMLKNRRQILRLSA